MKVNASFVVHDIVEVNEVNGYAVIALHFIAIWIDPRLALPCYPSSGRMGLDFKLHSSIWRPATRMAGATMGRKPAAPSTVQTTEIRYDGKPESPFFRFIY